MKKLTLISLTLIMIALFSVPALAKHNGWSDRDTPEGIQQQRAAQLELLLDLTPKQAAEIREIIKMHRQKSKEQRELAKRNHEKVEELIHADTLDESRLRALLHEQADLKAQRMVSRHSVQDEINRILTPEQQEKRDALRQMKKQGKHFSKQMPPRELSQEM